MRARTRRRDVQWEVPMQWSKTLAACAAVAIVASSASCVEDVQGPGAILRPSFSTAGPPGASVPVQVQVPASMRSSPFDVPRFLNVPPDFSIAVYTRIGGARFLA